MEFTDKRVCYYCCCSFVEAPDADCKISSHFSSPALSCNSCAISNKNQKALTPQKQNVIWDDKFCHRIVVKTQCKRVKIDMQITMSSIQKRACRNIR